MADFDMQSSCSEDNNSSDEELQEAFAKGELKPGLNIEFQKPTENVNNISKLLSKTDDIRLDLPWIERLDMINELAALAPELTVQLEKHEQKRANQFKGNAKLHYVQPTADPILNDFKREMLFHRQAQSAVVEGIKRLHELGIVTKRPEDYFAEMSKTDEHMQKVRSNLMAKQEGQAKSERIKQIREQRKMGKMLAKQTKVSREMEKKDMLDQIKKFRKGKLKNLDFLDDAKATASKKSKSAANRKSRDKKFGFGGRKRGLKSNTKGSSMGIEKVKNFQKGPKGGRGGKKAGATNKRLGKSKRVQAKSRK